MQRVHLTIRKRQGRVYFLGCWSSKFYTEKNIEILLKKHNIEIYIHFICCFTKRENFEKEILKKKRKL
jgi:hypothetical protein